MIDKLVSSLRAVADLVMPRICLCCGRELELWEEHLCQSCMEDLPRTRYWKLRENPMAEAYNHLIQMNMGEDAHYQPYGYAVALYFYRGGFRHISKSLKYKRNFEIGRCFARLLGRSLAESPYFGDVDLVVPVPLHWMRRWQRGYNQAEIIAWEVARELGVECCPELVVRARRTRTQTHLHIEGRTRNVAGAFCIGKIPPRLAAVAPRHILLIDDVFTTGATAASCEAAIHAGLSTIIPPAHLRISIATLACVER